MKANKRLFAGVLAGAMCLGALSGCGGSGTGSSDASNTDDSYKISFILKHTDGHFLKVIAGANAYVEEHPNITVDIQSPTSSTAYDEQINMIETSLGNTSYDAVIISPLQSDSTATLVANTDDVIIACDTDFTSDKKTAFVGTGNEDAARSGGETATKEAIKRGASKPTAVILTGVQGDETHEDRLKGYTDGIESNGGELLEVQYCDALADKAANAMEAIIQKYPQGVDIVCATGDDMALAAGKAIQDSGNKAYNDTVLCGFDGNQSAIEAIQEGTLTMCVAQLGYDMGYKAVEAAVNALNGEKVDSFIDSGSLVVTADNTDDYIKQMKEIGVWED